MHLRACRRIMAEDFVAMSMYQTEAGEFEAILPAEELEAIYKRITENEIKVGRLCPESSVGVGRRFDRDCEAAGQCGPGEDPCALLGGEDRWLGYGDAPSILFH